MVIIIIWLRVDAEFIFSLAVFVQWNLCSHITGTTDNELAVRQHSIVVVRCIIFQHYISHPKYIVISVECICCFAPDYPMQIKCCFPLKMVALVSAQIPI